MKRASTVEEYIALVQDALYEIDDMRAAIEFDSEGMGEAPKFVDEADEILKDLYATMKSGDYCWKTGDLRYMDFICDAHKMAWMMRSEIN
jgi:hypothetical protein